MLKLIIEDDEGRKTVVPFVRDEITIGRQEGNTIRLTERNVSRHHARLVRQDGHVVVEDLGSYNGVRINGERIRGHMTLQEGDHIQIGDYDLALQQDEDAPQPSSRLPAAAGDPLAAMEGDDDEPIPAGTPVLEPELDLKPSASPQDSDEEILPLTPPLAEQRRASSAPAPVTSPAGQTESTEKSRLLRGRELPPEEAPRLLVVNPELTGQEFTCNRTELRIGRTDDNDIVIDHRSLSRTHAKLVRAANGDWRIVDMQSANGMMLNGESRLQATLSHGDLIALGHVKLRFIAAGQSAEGLAHAGPRQSSKRPLGLVLGLGVLALGGFWLAFGSRSSDEPASAAPPLEVAHTKPEPQPAEPTPTQEQAAPPQQQAEAPKPQAEPKQATAQQQAGPKQAEPKQATTQQQAGPKQAEPKQATAQQQAGPKQAEPKQAETETPPPSTPAVEEKLRSAREAIAARHFDQAVNLLAPLKDAQGRVPEGVEALLEQARTERQAKKSLELAQKELTAGRPQEAAKRLDDSQGTTAYAEEHAALRKKVEAALAAAKSPPPASRVEQRPPSEEAELAFDDGTALVKQKQYKEAELRFKRCLEIAPRHAECHLMLGVTYANQSQPDQAAPHYRQFLRLAPAHEKAEMVRKIVDDYERQTAVESAP